MVFSWFVGGCRTVGSGGRGRPCGLEGVRGFGCRGRSGGGVRRWPRVLCVGAGGGRGRGRVWGGGGGGRFGRVAGPAPGRGCGPCAGHVRRRWVRRGRWRHRRRRRRTGWSLRGWLVVWSSQTCCLPGGSGGLELCDERFGANLVTRVVV